MAHEEVSGDAEEHSFSHLDEWKRHLVTRMPLCSAPMGTLFHDVQHEADP